MFLVICTIYEQ